MMTVVVSDLDSLERSRKFLVSYEETVQGGKPVKAQKEPN